MTDFMNEMTQKMMSELQEKRENFLKKMLIKKGHLMIVEMMVDKVRFPKINRSICDGWEYVFVDNNTKQGEFIVAIGPWEPATQFDFSQLPELKASCMTTYTFKWQDTNFDAVRL